LTSLQEETRSSSVVGSPLPLRLERIGQLTKAWFGFRAAQLRLGRLCDLLVG